MDKDRIKGSAKQLKGTIKEAAGKAKHRPARRLVQCGDADGAHDDMGSSSVG